MVKWSKWGLCSVSFTTAIKWESKYGSPGNVVVDDEGMNGALQVSE